MEINIRVEEESDYRTVEEMTRETFWNLYVPGCDEHYVAHTIRKHPDFVPEMDFVAEVDGKIVGSIMYTKSYVIDENDHKVGTLTFGPFCVSPEYQNKGIGTALVNYSKIIAIQKNYKAIIILGDPRNYCRYGFKNCKDHGVSDSEGKYPFGQLVLELEKGFFSNKKWKFYFSQGYNINPEQVAEFDASFPGKEKSYQPSQELFSIMTRAYL